MLDYAIKITRTPVECDEADIEKLRSLGFSLDDVYDIITTASVYNYNNGVAEPPGICRTGPTTRLSDEEGGRGFMADERDNAKVVAPPPSPAGMVTIVSVSAFAVIYAGIASVANALWAILLLPATLYVLRRGVIEREERYLERKFGHSEPASGLGFGDAAPYRFHYLGAQIY